MDLLFNKVELHCQANNSAHHTSDITTEKLIVRRGQSFLLTIDMPRPFTPDSQLLLFTVQTGFWASEERGTKSLFGSAEDLVTRSPVAKAVWTAQLQETSNSSSASVTLSVTPPADTPVGRYYMTLEREEKERSIGSLVVLFNPWCPEDWVYLPEEEERQEYVMNEQGIIFKGTDKYISSMAWDYGQFEEDIVDICLKMLDVNPKHLRDPADDVSARCNPIYVGRVASAMINAQGDRGVLVGSWNTSFYNGVPPTHWNGSAGILQRWRQNGCHPVKYGQCWVFAGVMCSVLRCLGIPCRVVTNYQSAHDTDQSLTIDTFYSDYGVRPKESADSIWNFHVWVEAWMRRPDLDEDGGCDGWQVLDPTPQERSRGVFCCGPASVNAIRSGDTHLKYDAPFVFAEVNADVVSWLITANGSRQQVYSDPSRVGQNISTKSVGSDKKRNITDTYKHREGSEKEREVFEHAVTRDWSGHRQLSVEGGRQLSVEGDRQLSEEGGARNEEEATGGNEEVNGGPPAQQVAMQIKEVMEPINGQDVHLKLMLSSRERTDRPLSVSINVQVMFYTGVPAVVIHTQVEEHTLQPGQDLSIPVVIPFSAYRKLLLDCDSLKVSAVATDRQNPEHIYLTESDIILQDPPISITVSGRPQKYQPFNVEVVFANPLHETLTDCTFTITGSGLIAKDLEMSLPDLLPNHRIRLILELTPYKSGSKTLVVDFDSSVFRDIKASATIDIEPHD